MKCHFGHKILFLKSRRYIKSRFVKLRLYCSLLQKIHVEEDLTKVKDVIIWQFKFVATLNDL